MKPQVEAKKAKAKKPAKAAAKAASKVPAKKGAVKTPARKPVVSAQPLMAYPEDLVIPDQPGHVLTQPERNALPTNENTIASILAVGVIQPVIVRRDKEDRLVVEDGRQRVKNAREANRQLEEKGLPRRKVPYVLSYASEAEAVTRGIVTNHHRFKDLPSQVVRDVAAYMALGHSADEAMMAFNLKSKAHVSSSLLLADAAGEVLAALDNGVIRLSAAVRIARMPREEQAAVLEAAGGGEEDDGASGSDAETPASPPAPQRVTARQIEQAAAERDGRAPRLPLGKKQALAFEADLQGLLTEKGTDPRVQLAIEAILFGLHTALEGAGADKPDALAFLWRRRADKTDAVDLSNDETP
jgi:ParB family chromosome partitioning protein